jgi:hypothetical protein
MPLAILFRSIIIPSRPRPLGASAPIWADRHGGVMSDTINFISNISERSVRLIEDLESWGEASTPHLRNSPGTMWRTTMRQETMVTDPNGIQMIQSLILAAEEGQADATVGLDSKRRYHPRRRRIG